MLQPMFSDTATASSSSFHLLLLLLQQIPENDFDLLTSDGRKMSKGRMARVQLLITAFDVIMSKLQKLKYITRIYILDFFFLVFDNN